MQRNIKPQGLTVPGVMVVAGVVIIIGSMLPYYTQHLDSEAYRILSPNYSSPYDVEVYRMLFSDPSSGVPLDIFALMVIGLGLSCFWGWKRNWYYISISILSLLGTAFFLLWYDALSSEANARTNLGFYESVGSGIIIVATGMFLSFLGSTIHLIMNRRSKLACMAESKSETIAD